MTRLGLLAILARLHESPGRGQLEPIAGRVEEFLRELAEMGPNRTGVSPPNAMNPKADAVVLVTDQAVWIETRCLMGSTLHCYPIS